ncbi:conserved hypothetical secreted protein [Helicobacter bizzozeronii CCUG 35545]|nr:conserved hypothetical secreted protein [Helicobacter bizzozeronii CCUG 35545]
MVLSSLYAWRLAWAKNDLASYLEFYASSFRHANGMDFKAYQRFKTKIFAKNENKTIRFSQINVTPYPNNEDRSLFRVAFMQTYEAYKHKKTCLFFTWPQRALCRDQKQQDANFDRKVILES